MKMYPKIAVGIVLAVAIANGIAFVWPPAPTQNPDLNHTHADFAVWIGGTQVNFSAPEFMSGSSTDAGTHPTEGLRQYLHLHDGNGHVIHRHKPALTLGDFFGSIGFGLASSKGSEWCWYVSRPDRPFDGCQSGSMRLFVDGKLQQVGSPFDYVFADGDRILLTDAVTDADVQKQLAVLTDDACRYSKTCPWRGTPPTESCIADPEVPCKE